MRLSQTLEMAAKVVGSDRTFRGKPSLKTVPIRPFLGLLTNFATGPYGFPSASSPGLRCALECSCVFAVTATGLQIGQAVLIRTRG
jgi:hypothetical protein